MLDKHLKLGHCHIQMFNFSWNRHTVELCRSKCCWKFARFLCLIRNHFFTHNFSIICCCYDFLAFSLFLHVLRSRVTVMAIQSQLARHGCMVMAFLSLGSSVMAFMSWLSCHGYTITTCLLLLSGHGVPVAVFLSHPSCHGCPAIAICLWLSSIMQLWIN